MQKNHHYVNWGKSVNRGCFNFDTQWWLRKLWDGKREAMRR